MKRIVRNCIFILLCSVIPLGIAFAQTTSEFENGRQLNKQEVLDLISNKTVTYRITIGTRNATSYTTSTMKLNFTKSEEAGGTLSAYAPGSSTDGKWSVNDAGRLVRQYDKVSWGNKPFSVGVFESGGKYAWKLGGEFQELLTIQ